MLVSVILEDEVAQQLIKLCALLGVTTDTWVSEFLNNSTMFGEYLEERIEDVMEDR